MFFFVFGNDSDDIYVLGPQPQVVVVVVVVGGASTGATAVSER